MRSGLKRIVAGVLFAVVICAGILLAATGILALRSRSIQTPIDDLGSDPEYAEALLIDKIEIIEQEISCGYAVIEMLSRWMGGNVTEETLYAQYGRVVTATGKAFCEELNRQFPRYTTTMYTYLPNHELIQRIHRSLADGIPVPIEWAAQHDGAWTLHYSLVTGIDIPSGRIIVANPYGYMEALTFSDFLTRTSFEAYDSMPFWLKMGFAFGLFEKNAIFIMQPAQNESIKLEMRLPANMRLSPP